MAGATITTEAAAGDDATITIMDMAMAIIAVGMGTAIIAVDLDAAITTTDGPLRLMIVFARQGTKPGEDAAASQGSRTKSRKRFGRDRLGNRCH